ncbi:MAG: PAS domain S-box protein [Dehalococcoidales bacterium]|nr:PAS domain S-box protein [Dehalococcoidales bacterium]
MPDINYPQNGEALQNNKQSLEQAYALLDAVSKGTNVLLAVIDTGYCYTYFNQNYQEEIKRLTGKDISLGMNMLEVFGHQPEQQKVILKEWGPALQGRNSNKVLEFGEPGLHRGVYTIIHTPIRDAAGNITGAGEVASDITQRKKIESEIAHLASFPEMNPNPVLELGQEGNVIYQNPTTKRLFPDLLTKGLNHPFLADIAPLLARLKNNTFGTLERDVNTGKDYYEQTITYVAESDSFRLYARNITERKKAQESLLKEKIFSETIIDSLPGIFFLFKNDGKFIQWNLNFERITGYSGQEFPTLTPADMVETGEKEMVSERIRQVFTTGRGSVEATLVSKNGKRTAFFFTGLRVRIDGESYIIGTGNDISERKRIEAELLETSDYLNNLLNYTNVPIIVWNPQFIITRVNPAFERLTGYAAADTIGKKLDMLFPKGKKSSSLKQIHRTLAGERFEVVEIPILRKDGGELIVLWNSANVLDNEGKSIIATIAQGVDITERKQAEDNILKLNATLEQHAAELEVANKEIEAFAYSVSHDLRAPLRSMEGFSQALLEDFGDVLNDEGKDYLKRIQGSAELMAQLIDDLLALSRITRTEMRQEEVNLSEMVESICASLKKTQPKPYINIVIAPGMQVQGDSKLLRIMLENLLGNAWKFTGKTDFPRIECGKAEINGKTTYFVRDNGVGYDMEYGGKLFTPFQRLHTEADFPGTGIGLASVQRIIHRHGGEVWAEGKTGKGATFYFTLE